MGLVWFVHLALKLSLLTAAIVALTVAPLYHALGPVPHPVHGGSSILYFFGISIGIKRRLIDIAKKITFYFLQNV